MARIRDDKPRLSSAGYMTATAMIANLNDLVRLHLQPALDAKGDKARLLDVGCGQSPYKKLLQRWPLVGVNLDAVDASPDVAADAQALPFANGSFSAVVCTQVIEHVPHPEIMLREIARCLEPGGYLLLSGPMHWPLHEEPFDFWRFTRHGFRRLLQDNGFELIDLRDDGHAIALAVQAVNHLFRGPIFAPLRMGLNLLGTAAENIFVIRHSTPNLSLVARRLPS